MKFTLEKIETSYFDKKINLRLPGSPTYELAEFIGLLLGDGYMNKYGEYFSLLEIAGDSRLDQEYLLGYVSPMIKSLFNIKPKINFKKNENSMYLRLMSKGLINYLEEIGFIKGNKKNISIPELITKDDQYIKSFVKGLMDTDGSLVLLNRNQKKYRFYPRISLGLDNKSVVNFVGNWLQKQGISLCFF